MPFSNQTERVGNQPAFILHRRLYRDSSLILDVFSKDYGRLSLVAKGANSQKSRLKGVLQAFQPLVVAWSRKSDMGTMTSAETLCPPYNLLNDALYSAMYLNELMFKLTTRDDPHPEIFIQYQHALIQLADNHIEQTLRIFEKRLLQSIGYEIDFFMDAESHQPIEGNKYYEFVADLGFIESSKTSPTVLRFAGKDLINIGNDCFTDERVLKTARKIMQINIKRLVGNEELQTRELYKAYLNTKSH